MTRSMECVCAAAVLISCTASLGNSQTAIPGAEPPKSWIDSDTGHRVVRLTDEPGGASLYFNQNSYTADGNEMVFTTPNGISMLHLDTRRRAAFIT